MQREEFEELVADALSDLPEEFQKKLENIGVVVVDEPPLGLLNELGIKPPDTLLGLYQGVPLRRRGSAYFNALPDRVTIYQKPIERICHNEAELKQKVQEVVMHEIGHYFGLSERDLERI